MNEPKLIQPSFADLVLALLQLTKNRLDFRKELERIKSSKVRDVMVKDVVTISPQADLIEVATVMEKHKVSKLPVVDKNDRLVGIVTRADVVRAITLGAIKKG